MTAIERYARQSPNFDERIAHAVAVLQSAAAEHVGAIVQASSLGVEAMVLTDLIARHQLPIAVATLDTGRLHAETLALIARIEQRYGIVVERWQPRDEAVIRFVTRHGVDPMYRSAELRRACCELRKVEPLARMLQGRSAWITGRRRQQSATRDAVPFHEHDRDGRLKLNPLADWSWGDVWHYVASRDVPYNELHDRRFPSIGCEPCTRAIADGEDFRAGRWWWENDDARECGLHGKPHSAAPAATSRSEAGAVVPAQAHIGAADVKAAPAAGRSQNADSGLHVRPHSAAPAATPRSEAGVVVPAQAHIGAADVKAAPAAGRSQNADGGLRVRPHSAAPAATSRSEAGVVVPAQAHIGAADVKAAPAAGRSQNADSGLHVQAAQAPAARTAQPVR